MTMTTHLFQPYTLGSLELPNRIVMAPMTRNRADAAGVPVPMMAAYYAQRASGGLLITEAAQVSPQGQGYVNTPGIYTDAQVAGWRPVTDAVHAAGGRIFLQLWHVGRVSHTSFQPDGAAPVAPSAVRADTQVFTFEGFEPTGEPRALALEEIAPIVDQYRHGAARAKAAGFDGVEIHAANGYLIDQFLRNGANRRTDAYGAASPTASVSPWR
jgi:N-ethylmaleimide reductase